MEHLNRPSTVNFLTLRQMPQYSVQVEIGLSLSMAEVRKAILLTNSARAPGNYCIPVDKALETFHVIQQSICEEISVEFRPEYVSLYKNTGNKAD